MKFCNLLKLCTVCFYLTGLYQLNTHYNLAFLLVPSLLNLLSLCFDKFKLHLVTLYQVLLLLVCHLYILFSLYRFVPYTSLPCFSLSIQCSLINTSSVFLFSYQTIISLSSFSLWQQQLYLS